MTGTTRRKGILSVMVGIAVTAMLVSAQAWSRQDPFPPNPPYDGRFSFARLRYTDHPGDLCTCQVRGSLGAAGWLHDYPDADRNIIRIAMELTTLNARVDSGVVLKADDPALMRYPILYLTEPACWNPSESEVKALRKYLLKGGFFIVDDFAICTGGPERFAQSQQAFEEQMRRVLPNGKPILVDMSDPALNGFFRLNPMELQEELTRTAGPPPQVHGIYENNDPRKRLMVAANYNTAIHSSWVWQSRGLLPVDRRNEAYKLGVNYLMYGFTH